MEKINPQESERITYEVETRLSRKRNLEHDLDGMIIKLEELETLQSLNYEPYKQKQTKAAIRAMLNIRGFTSLKAFHSGDVA